MYGINTAKDNAEDVAKELHEADVTVVTVGVGVTPTYADYLKNKIADKPGNYEKFDCSYFMRAVSNLEREEF